VIFNGKIITENKNKYFTFIDFTNQIYLGILHCLVKTSELNDFCFFLSNTNWVGKKTVNTGIDRTGGQYWSIGVKAR
jgi:hypothetical protein